jgi:hypothetical protein
MTPLAHLVPPKLRSKARYMNLQELIAWGQATLGYLDDPHPVGAAPLDRAALAKKLGWLEEYRAPLAWCQANLGISLTAQRRQALAPPTEQIPDNPHATTSGNSEQARGWASGRRPADS